MERISFAGDWLGPDLIPAEELADCARTVLERDGRTILSYGASAGYTPLRALIAQWYGVHPSRVVLVNGSLHGLALVARAVARGRNVVAEYPIYDRAANVLLAAEASLLGAPVDGDGVVADEIHNMLVQYSTPALVYTIPNFQNPTGTVLPEPRRRRLLELVRGQSMVQVQGMQILEDDAYALTRFEGESEHALFDLSGKTTIYLSSFSTTIAPGLRVGWLILPDGFADEIAAAAADTYITPSLLAQATVFEFITRGSFERHLGELRGALRLRRDAMVAAIERHLPGSAYRPPQGGFFVWVELPGQPDGRAVLARAQGVEALDGTAFSALSSFLRLSYAASTPDEIDAGVARIAAAL